jgi:hypothetical protein
MERNCEYDSTAYAFATVDKGWSSSLGIWREAKNTLYYEVLNRAFDMAGSREHGDEPSSSTQGEEILVFLRDC